MATLNDFIPLISRLFPSTFSKRSKKLGSRLDKTKSHSSGYKASQTLIKQILFR